MSMNTTGTLLEIFLSGNSRVPLYSARGLTQVLRPIDAATNVTYSINGDAMDLSYEQFRKYETEITCTDVETPAIDNIWPGMNLTVDCTCELSFRTALASAGRTIVSGSSRIEGAFTFYRPRLLMKLVEIEIAHSEYPADYAWRLRLVER